LKFRFLEKIKNKLGNNLWWQYIFSLQPREEFLKGRYIFGKKISKTVLGKN
jgi:hypothetical protein